MTEFISLISGRTYASQSQNTATQYHALLRCRAMVCRGVTIDNVALHCQAVVILIRFTAHHSLKNK